MQTETEGALTPRRSRRRGLPALAVTGLLGAGGVAGALISATTTATAAPSSSSTAASGSTSTSNGSSPSANAPPPTPQYGSAPPSGSLPPTGTARGLPDNGTVTAVGSSSVTIKTSSGTTTYAVTSTSDIDKNGEAQLSDLAVGDTVTFSTVASSATPTIDKLHVGNEALDMPKGPPPTTGSAPPSSATAPSSSSSTA